MATLNPHFDRLNKTYIFPVIEEKLAQLKSTLPDASILNFGIGDIARPLAPSVAQAIAQGVLEMSTEGGIRGYGPSQGYAFLRETICSHEFAKWGINADEIFVSDGANSDAVNILDLFELSSSIGIMSPSYPAYLDASILRGHDNIIQLPCTQENHFIPLIPTQKCELIYLCSPNNPTGVAMTRAAMQTWVDYALENEAILLLDNAYEAFINSRDVPRSIFELPGAKECAIEFRSFSKSAGFTGLRCAYTILPHTVQARMASHKISLHPFWMRRQATKFNGVAYPIQRGAEAVYSAEGQQETKTQVSLYLAQAKQLKTKLSQRGLTCYGGVDSPFLWVKTPQNLTSWEFFDLLLKRCHLLSIPGCGFGPQGEGFVRFSAFTTPEKIALALERLNGL